VSDTRAKLLRLFAKLPLDVIDADMRPLLDAFNVETYDNLKALPDYEEEYKRAREAKRKIERIAEVYKDSIGDQALQCLAWLQNLRAQTVHKNPEYLVSRDLLARTLQAQWKEPDLGKFKARFALLDGWCDVFLSYTNRNSMATNKRYKRLISDELGWPGDKEVQERNYLARVLAKFLEQESVRGFADFKNLECGDDIEAVVLGRSATAFGFVQLVEDVTLTEPLPPALNWCEREYDAFTKADLPVAAPAGLGNRLFFVLAGANKMSKPAGLAPNYDPWYQKIAASLDLVIDMFKQKPPDDLKAQIRGIAEQIVTARKTVLNSMLDAW